MPIQEREPDLAIEPERHWRQHLTDRPPLWLLDALQTCVAGWFLANFRWERLPDGRYKTETCWLRKEPWVEVLDYDEATMLRFQIYQKTKLPTILRLLWLLLCCQWFEGAGILSCPTDKENG